MVGPANADERLQSEPVPVAQTEEARASAVLGNEGLAASASQVEEANDEVSETQAAPELGRSSGEALSAALGHDLSPLGMYQAADWVVKAVMIGLLLASVLTWAVWLFKNVQLRVASTRGARLLGVLVDSESFAAAAHRADALKGGGLLLLQASNHELSLSAQGPASDAGIKERVGARLERVQASLASRMNRGTGVLATIGSVAPFVGLFGTVWGIMNSFIGIAETKTTNLAVVAPGIAEALLATAIGLVAAIPAVVIYNHFSRAIGSYRAQLADISTALLTLISRDLDRHHPDARALAELVQQDQANVVAMNRGTA